ncbi:MAG: ferritin [Elusimicrobia bacterium]|nr:ferritin [Elusimicrobiota bacterium]
MLDKKLEQALNEQVVKEFYSAYLYLAMAGWFEEQVLPGMAKWMRVQAQEESCHALIFFNYLCEKGARPALGAVAAPPAKFKSTTDIFKAVLAHEQAVTASINGIADLALELRDHATKQALDWFVKEQVEEESSAEAILRKAQRLEGDKALFLLDQEAGTRVFVLPVPLTGKI